MNERIQELVEQARRYAEDKQNDPLRIYVLDMFTQKFAELIVKDAIDGLLNAYGPDDCLPQEEIAGFLKEHFGVE